MCSSTGVVYGLPTCWYLHQKLSYAFWGTELNFASWISVICLILWGILDIWVWNISTEVLWYWVCMTRCFHLATMTWFPMISAMPRANPSVHNSCALCWRAVWLQHRVLKMLFILEWLPSLEPLLIYWPSRVLLHAAFHLLLRTFVSLKDIHFQWVYSIFWHIHFISLEYHPVVLGCIFFFFSFFLSFILFVFLSSSLNKENPSAPVVRQIITKKAE